VAIDGSKFKAVNNRDTNFTRANMERRLAQIGEGVARYLHQLDSADRQEPSLARATKTTSLKDKICTNGFCRIGARAAQSRRDLRSYHAPTTPTAFSHSLDPNWTFAGTILGRERSARLFKVGRLVRQIRA